MRPVLQFFAASVPVYGGVLSLLASRQVPAEHSCEPGRRVLLRRAVFEHGEKLRALVGVRGVETAARRTAPGAEQLRSAVDDTIERAGAHCSPQVLQTNAAGIARFV